YFMLNPIWSMAFWWPRKPTTMPRTSPFRIVLSSEEERKRDPASSVRPRRGLHRGPAPALRPVAGGRRRARGRDGRKRARAPDRRVPAGEPGTLEAAAPLHPGRRSPAHARQANQDLAAAAGADRRGRA